MQTLCGLQGIFDLFNCKTPEFIEQRYENLKLTGTAGNRR